MFKHTLEGETPDKESKNAISKLKTPFLKGINSQPKAAIKRVL